MTLYDELRAVLAALDGAQVEYALIGGLAVAVWGAPRATKDIDLLVEREALIKAKQALQRMGYSLEAFPLEFKDGTEVHRINKVDASRNLMTVDLMLVDKNLQPAWRERMQVPFGDRTISVVSRDALIAMKARAARPQDIADIENLRDIDR